MRRGSAASVDSQFPVDPHASRGAPRREARAATRNSRSIPATRGPSPGGSRRGLRNASVNEMRCASAASVDSQFPVDPRYAGALARRLAPLAFTLDEAAQLLRPRWMAQLAQRLGFDLPDALARDVELLADFLQRVIGVHLDPEAHPKHLGLARRQRVQ